MQQAHLIQPPLHSIPAGSIVLLDSRRAMNPLSLELLPRALPLRPFTATAPSKPTATGLAGARTTVVQRRRRRLWAASAAVAREAARASEATSPSATSEERFDWLDQWYPIAPVGELDPGAPHGKTVLGLSVVAWYDRAGAGEWRVFEDACPHRLAPLSEGRVDGKGRLQCAYHGWCFDGAGACRFIPQAPALGAPVHANSRACVASYPSVVQNQVLWFYPRTEAEFRDVLQRKRPPFFDELDDPSYFAVFGMRDFPYGYDILIENLIDPAHVPYTHRGLNSLLLTGDLACFFTVVHDREGGDPITIKIEQANIDGFLSRMKRGNIQFEAPCALHGTNPRKMNVDGEVEPWFMFVIFCVPVSPGRSRLIWLFPRNGGVWLHKITPRWYSHMFTNLIFDSDLYLLHIQERKLAAVGLDNWHQACYVPTSSDGMTVAFRNWFRKYCKSQIDWATPQADLDRQLPPIQSKDKVMDRYWSHVVQCRSCSAALKAMGALEVALQVASVAAIGFLAFAKGTTTTLAASVVHRAATVAVAVLCFAASRWLAGFIEKNFHFQDYERRIAAKGIDNWQSSCYVPASSDIMVVAFRNWFRKYCKNQVGWATPQPDQLPPTPTKDTLMERYWSHVVQCSSCSAALKAMRALEVALQVASVAVVGFLAVAKETLAMSAARRNVAVAAAVLCFAMSRWLASFIQKNFFFQDYSHAYNRGAMNALSPSPLPRPLLAQAAPRRSRTPSGGARFSVPRRGRWAAARIPVSAVPHEARTEEPPSSPSLSGEEERFDWLDQWYPFAPVCDLDPSAPHGKTVLGLSVVAWYDRAGAGEWRVFDDACPHRLAPLSEGRVDGEGRLQCAYHGWCFDGAGACQFIPQAAALGPPVHKNSRACVASYPCVVQNKILWFYPRTEAEHRDALQRKRPPYIPEIDDPSYLTVFGHDQEGGDPIKMKIEQAGIDGFLSVMEGGNIRFTAPCTYHGTSADKVAAGGKTQPFLMIVAFLIPVGPGRSRLIWAIPTNAGVWLGKIIPRWFMHISSNSILDSDAFLLHIQNHSVGEMERKYAVAGLDNWQKATYVPTSSDSMIIAFRRWFRKHCKNQVGWATPQVSQLPPTPAKDKLLQRYWSHVAQCRSCSGALKAMRAAEVALQIASVVIIGFLAASNAELIKSAVHRTVVVSAAVLCFGVSRWMANFIDKNFYFQDYVHAYNHEFRLIASRNAAKVPQSFRLSGSGHRGAMDALSLSPITRPSLPLAAPLRSRRPSGGARVFVPRRWRRAARARVSVSAVATETPRTEEPQSSSPSGQGRFDWLDQWYPLAPVCDLDPRAPHGKTVLGLSVVAWYDRGAGEWRVFDDACPHRLAPLSEGRIDGKGRLQCVYHGWCFDGAGACKFIPQAPALGPPVHTNSKACVASYPCVVQNNILWFYPRAEPEYKDVLQRKRPPLVPEIDDPEFVTVYGMRDLPYGYDILVENLMDPAHVPYAHKGIMRGIRKKEDPGRYGGGPIKMMIEQANIEGFLSPQDRGYFQFVAPCMILGSVFPQEGKKKVPRVMLVFFCVPVAPGKSRVIWAFPRNIGVWLHHITPRWLFHIGQNLILDSDIFLLHIEERKFAAAGLDNWQKACYVPTTSDNMVIAFRNWFRKFCKNQVGWATPQVDQLPPTPTKDQLMERYWSHVVQCTSCSAALKAMKAIEAALQVASVAVVGFLAIAKETLITSTAQRAMVVSAAVLCFAASRWLANFIQKNFYFQDYIHAYNVNIPQFHLQHSSVQNKTKIKNRIKPAINPWAQVDPEESHHIKRNKGEVSRIPYVGAEHLRAPALGGSPRSGSKRARGSGWGPPRCGRERGDRMGAAAPGSRGRGVEKWEAAGSLQNLPPEHLHRDSRSRRCSLLLPARPAAPSPSLAKRERREANRIADRMGRPGPSNLPNYFWLGGSERDAGVVGPVCPRAPAQPTRRRHARGVHTGHHHHHPSPK
ncbi:hypothetical protein U9M48_010902 [Paspalum notatum var. saurae]|uniref:Rieske domain-containing protein n=1 Tax=Paspalum notatum var. saurae TaxID=547442 RepID=A0AAQ3WGI5_PASNO